MLSYTKPNINLIQRYFIRFIRLNWLILFLLTILTAIGVATLYSASGGNMDPWARNHMVRFGFALFITVLIGMVNIKYWFKLSYTVYFLSVLLLFSVEYVGVEIAGAKRWIDFGISYIQPSEVMKISLILAISKYLSECGDVRLHWVKSLLIPLLLIFIPLILVLKQPDLGTGLLLLFSGISVIFVAGISYWFISGGILSFLISLPFIWSFLHDYQKERVLTFLNPERDPLGSGYHIIQSKIAIGSGGFLGKGFLNGSQSQLDFIPEIHTDFIFAIFSEEFGLFGSLLVLFIFSLIITYCIYISYKVKDHFSRLLVFVLSVTIILYVFSNIAMVIGIIPVVGVPLPLISYGGTAMVTVMTAIGLVMSANFYTDS